MEVRFQPNVDDYYAAQQYICRSVTKQGYWKFLPTVLGFTVVICFGVGLIAIVKFYDNYDFLKFYELNWGLGLISFALFSFLFVSRLYNRTIKARMFGPGGLYSSPHTITVGNENLKVLVKENTYIYSFTDILRVEQDSNYVFIFIDNGVALYIPNRDFETNEIKSKFIDDILNKIHR